MPNANKKITDMIQKVIKENVSNVCKCTFGEGAGLDNDTVIANIDSDVPASVDIKGIEEKLKFKARELPDVGENEEVFQISGEVSVSMPYKILLYLQGNVTSEGC